MDFMLHVEEVVKKGKTPTKTEPNAIKKGKKTTKTEPNATLAGRFEQKRNRFPNPINSLTSLQKIITLSPEVFI